MNKQVLEILEKQEVFEQNAYQSSNALKDMIRHDLQNSAEILQAIDKYHKDLPELFQTPSLVPFFHRIPIPVRKCDFFHVCKHTRSQIPYLHTHAFYEFIYVLYGECKQHLESPYVPIYLKTHESCLLPPGIIHEMERCGKDDIILKFSIPVHLYEEILSPILHASSSEHVLLFDRHNMQMDWCIYMLLKEYNNQRDFYKTSIKNYLSSLFIELVRKPVQQDPEIIVRLRSTFENAPCQLSLHEFAAQIGYSDDYVGRVIKKLTGKTFTEFVLDLKLAKAAKMLVETEDSITLIADSLGYANPSGFYKQFYRTYGMSPYEYRKTFS